MTDKPSQPRDVAQNLADLIGHAHVSGVEFAEVCVGRRMHMELRCAPSQHEFFSFDVKTFCGVPFRVVHERGFDPMRVALMINGHELLPLSPPFGPEPT